MQCLNSHPHITLFDVSCTLDPPAWSPNVWRTRFVLNYKNLPYETQWVHYPDIADTLHAAKVPPSRPEPPLYTVPAIIDRRPGGPSESQAISDSLLILNYLEEQYPLPSLFPGNTRDPQEEIINAIMEHIIMKSAFMVMSTTTNILDMRDTEYFLSSRKRIFGIGVERMCPEEEREQVYQSLEVGFTALSKIIDEKGVGGKTWIFGDDPTYADFVLVAQFIWLDKAGPAGVWNRVKKWNSGRWESLYLSAEKYMRVV